MAREFIITKTFEKNWSGLGLNDEDLRKLQNHILSNPFSGGIIEGAGGLVKLRWKLPNVGKSGVIPTLYVDFIRHETAVFVSCYAKSAKDTLTDKEKAEYKQLIKAIRKGLSQ